MEIVMRHEARQVPSWLTFDVGQKKGSDVKHAERAAQFGCREIESIRWRKVSTRGSGVDRFRFEFSGFGCIPNFEPDGIRSMRGKRNSGVRG